MPSRSWTPPTRRRERRSSSTSTTRGCRRGAEMGQTFCDFPFAIDGTVRTAISDEHDHLRDLIHQVLFTSPGERVNRPDFGCGLKNLVFMPNREPLAAATQLLVKGALQNWLQAEIQ